jgi:hypothetical protein
MCPHVSSRAAQIDAEYGNDINEALLRWDDAGAFDGGSDASSWLSVAFLFGRNLRDATASAVVVV